ncbi:MAG: hypothetical protein HONDAALG_00229 [Gammaproteobacteria bacterium]|nr:hypothetical protein [Gammaproteobacteria bacterium]
MSTPGKRLRVMLVDRLPERKNSVERAPSAVTELPEPQGTKRGS